MGQDGVVWNSIKNTLQSRELIITFTEHAYMSIFVTLVSSEGKHRDKLLHQNCVFNGIHLSHHN